MMRAKSLFLILFVSASIGLHGQYTKEFKRIFFDADYLFETGFYKEAFNRYKNLLTLDPGNSNILFRCGACCLNIPGNESVAVTYLKDAVEEVTMSYKETSHKESGAPVLSYFMLGQAYHLNYLFDEAIEYYTKFLDVSDNKTPMQLDYAQIQIEACKRASELDRARPSFEFQSVLDHFEDELPSCSNPVISGAGDVLIFLVDYPSDKKIMMTTKTGDLWSRPRVINSELGMVGETYPVSLSYEGDVLYLVHQFYSHSDIFVSRLQGNRWSEAEALGYTINGRTSENHASISKDGKSLYFTSDVRGGSGSFDIYVAHLDEKGDWRNPTNLGSTINTQFEEHTPFISSNDSIIFFSSQGHASIGGLDVFYSELNSNGIWGEPISLGYPVNTTGDDVFFNPGWDELEGYYAVRRLDDPTSNTISMVLELEYEDEEELAISSPVESDTAQEVDRPVATEVIPPESEPIAESTTTDPPAAENAVVEAIPETVAMAIEPEETNEIEEVLNRNARRPLTVEPGPETEASTESTSEQPGAALSYAGMPSIFETAVPFDHNRFNLNMAAMLEIEKIAVIMNKNPQTMVELVGHADATGSAQHNMLLSFQRAEQIADFLKKKGVNSKRIKVDGKGDTAPMAKDTNPDGSDAPLGRYLNRQVYVKIAGSVPASSELAGVYVPENLKISGNVGNTGTLYNYNYTIQLSANRSPIPLSRFEAVGKATEYSCTDGYYRYAVGTLRTFKEATEQLRIIRESGYEGAFIQSLAWYERAMR